MSDVEFGLRLRTDVSESRKLSTVSDDLGKVKAAAKDTGAALGSTSAEVQKLIDKYDPLGAKLRSLKSDFQALSQAAAGGNVGALDDNRYDAAMAKLRSEINATKEAIAGYGTAHTASMAKVTEATEKGMLATAGAKRELIVLAHEAMTGNFSRMPGSFMVLAERMSITEALLSPITLGFAGLAVAAGALAVAYAKGHEEMVAMNNALQVTGDYAGLTRGSMRQLAESMTADGTVTIGVAKDIVTQLVASGRLGSESLQGVAKLASDFAHATGQDVAKVAPELVKLFSDPAKGAEELNRSMHFLGTEQQEYINHLVRIGDLEGARKVLLDDLETRIPKHAESLGDLARAWNAVAGAASSAWDKMMGIGRQQTLEEEIAQIKHQLATGGLDFAQDEGQVREYLARLESQLASRKEQAKAASDTAAANERQAQAQKEADKAATHQIDMLRDQLTLLNSVPSSDDIERRKLEINKEIRNIQRSMAAEELAISQTRIEGELKLQELAIQMGEAQNDSALKLRSISQEEHDRSATAFALQKNDVQIIAAIRERSAKTLTEQEKTQLDYRIQALRIEGQMIALRGQEKIREDQEAVKRSEEEARLVVDRAGLQWNKENNTKQRGFAIQPAADAQLQAELDKVTESSERARLAVEQMHLTGRLGAEAYTAALDDLNTRTTAQKQAVIDLAAQQQELNDSWEYGAEKALQKYQDQAKNVAATTEQAFGRAFSSMEDALVQFATTGKLNFSNLANSIISDIIRTQARAAMAPVTKEMGDWLSSIFGPAQGSTGPRTGSVVENTPNTYSIPVTTSANGNVFESTGLHQYVNTVQDRPTFFSFNRMHAFANGGVFAEAGPEAVMPLARDGQGRLGIRAQGGGVPACNVEIIIENQSGQPVTAQQSGAPRFDGERWVIGVILKDLGRHGQTAQTLEGLYGLRRSGI